MLGRWLWNIGVMVWTVLSLLLAAEGVAENNVLQVVVAAQSLLCLAIALEVKTIREALFVDEPED